MSEELRNLRAYRALIKERLECGCLMTEKDCGLHGPRDIADIMLVSCIFMSEHIRHYGTTAGLTTKAKETGALEGVAGFGVTPNWQFPSPHEERAQLLGASPPTPRVEWKPRFAVGDQVRIKAAGQLATIIFIAPRIVSEEPVYDCGIYGLELEHNLEPAPWKLPEPPENTETLAKNLPVQAGYWWIGINKPGWTKWVQIESVECGVKQIDGYLYRRPLPTPSTPETHSDMITVNKFMSTEEIAATFPSCEGWLRDSLNEKNALIEERDAALARASEAEKALSVMTIDRDAAIQARKQHFIKLQNTESELATLQASVPVWVPLSERAPVEKDGQEMKGLSGLPFYCMVIWGAPDFACFGHWDRQPTWATCWMRVPKLPLPPLPVETEEGKAVPSLAPVIPVADAQIDACRKIIETLTKERDEARKYGEQQGSFYLEAARWAMELIEFYKMPIQDGDDEFATVAKFIKALKEERITSDQRASDYAESASATDYEIKEILTRFDIKRGDMEPHLGAIEKFIVDIKEQNELAVRELGNYLEADKAEAEELGRMMKEHGALDGEFLPGFIARKDDQIADLIQALSPFALFATVYKDRKDSLTAVLRHKHQAVIVYAFQNAALTLTEALASCPSQPK